MQRLGRPPAPRPPLHTVTAWIVEQGGSVTARQIREHFEIGPGLGERLLREWMAAGEIVRTGTASGSVYSTPATVPVIPDGYKVCTSCLQTKSVMAFYADGGGHRKPRCIDCSALSQAERRKIHRCPSCRDAVRAPGLCGFCVEEQGGPLTEPEAPPENTPEANRAKVATSDAFQPC